MIDIIVIFLVVAELLSFPNISRQSWFYCIIQSLFTQWGSHSHDFV